MTCRAYEHHAVPGAASSNKCSRRTSKGVSCQIIHLGRATHKDQKWQIPGGELVIDETIMQ